MENDLKQRTKQFALRIIKMVVALPKTEECRVLGKRSFKCKSENEKWKTT
jgi:hypothetical protein